MPTAQQIANIINQSTKRTGATCSVVDGKAVAHVPAHSSLYGRIYESVAIHTIEYANSVVASMS